MSLVRRTGLAGAALLLSLLPVAAAAATPDLTRWPSPEAIEAIAGTPVSFPSHSPFTLFDVGGEDVPETPAKARLFLPPGASAADPVPAVILLHGASGVVEPRSPTYARQFAAQGVAALVVDVFGARTDRGTAFFERVLNITEAMFLADAFAGLRYLDSLPEVDGSRVALIGFSYGGMATTYAAYEQVAEAYMPDGRRFAGHVAFYGPCIASFEDNRATGAPLLMLFGGRDAIMDESRCGQVAAELEAGGGNVETVVYPEGMHQWDGRFGGPRTIGRSLAPCRLKVDSDRRVRDQRTWIAMSSSFTRKVILGLCTDGDGYLIGRDDALRARSNQEMGRFLARVFDRGAG